MDRRPSWELEERRAWNASRRLTVFVDTPNQTAGDATLFHENPIFTFDFLVFVSLFLAQSTKQCCAIVDLHHHKHKFHTDHHQKLDGGAGICFQLSLSLKFAWQFLQLMFDLFCDTRKTVSWLKDNERKEGTDWIQHTKPRLVHQARACAGVLTVNRCQRPTWVCLGKVNKYPHPLRFAESMNVTLLATVFWQLS